jgi:nucleoid-associated protein YgaU
MGYGLYNWQKQRSPEQPMIRRGTPLSTPPPAEPPSTRPAPTPAAHAPAPNVNSQEEQARDRMHDLALHSVANVGEAYRPLRQEFGDIPPISRPLHAAKDQLARGQDEEAFRLARESWQAVRKFKKNVASIPGVYQVVRGDTLWQIARAHSPVKQGPGWVTIWKANKSVVPNFNRIEVGTHLKIPQKRSDYNMPYWQPRPLN